MGGEVKSDWREYPEREVIHVGTQDMLLSRALNRGFAMPPQERPIDFGFLNVDALWALDEVQLMGPGRTTSAQLQLFWDAALRSHGLRQTIWMSATLGSQAGSTEIPEWMRSPERAGQSLKTPPLRHTDADLQHPDFAARSRAPKSFELRLDRPVAAEAQTKASRGSRKHASRPTAPAVDPGWTVESGELHTRTGLGKTSTIVIWLLALVRQAQSKQVRLPRRLVYIVNRRTVTGQAVRQRLQSHE